MHAHQNTQPHTFSLSLMLTHAMEEPMEEPEPVEFSEGYMPRYQGLCSQAPKDVDASLLGQTIMYQLTSPSGWFPAKSKKPDKQK